MRPQANVHRLYLVDDPVPGELPLCCLFTQFLDHLEYNERRAPNTVRAYRGTLRGLTEWCAERRIHPEHATPRQLAEWQKSLRRSGGTGSVANKTSRVRRAYRWGRSRASGRLLPDDPSDELHVGSVPRGVSRPISDNDLELALTTAPSHEVRTWMMLEAGTGIRPVQMASLTSSRVIYRPDGRADLHVTGKGSDHTVIAGRDVAAELRRYTRANPRGPLWRKATGQPIDAKAIYSRVNRHLAKLGLDDRSHGLRHWYLDHAWELTHCLRTVQECAGHASPATTAGYIPASTPGRLTIADGISDHLAGRQKIERRLG